MSNNDSFVIGVDLGGTKIYAAVVDKNGKIIATAKKKTKAECGFKQVATRISKCIFKAAENAKLNFEKQVLTIGIGSPGPLDLKKGEVIETPNLKWKNAPLKKELEKLTGKKVVVDNDANVGLIGEHAFGAGKGAQHVVGLFIGTGVGGGVIVDGKPLHGFNENAGELGHMIMNPNGPKCGCGNYGCLEAYASRTAIERKIRIAEMKGTSTKVFEQDRDKKIRSKKLANAFKKGDSAVTKAIEQSATYIGYGVASLLNIFNPEVVILGGGVVEAIGEPYVDIVRKVAEKNVFKVALRNVKIVPAMLGDNSAALGAAVLAWENVDK